MNKQNNKPWLRIDEDMYEVIVLETASPLKEAIGLYKQYGFEEFEADHLAARCDQAMQLLLY